MIIVVDRLVLPSWFERASGYVMPAVFAALVATSLGGIVGDAVAGHLATSAPVMAGAAAASVVALRRSAATAMLAGMAVMWLSQFLGGIAG
jgi:branched-subunit amino acid transport protein